MTGDKDAALTHFWGQALTLRFLMSDQFSGCAAGKCVWFGVSQSASHDGLISFYNSGGFTVVLRKQRHPFTQGRCRMPSATRCAHCKTQIAKQQITLSSKETAKLSGCVKLRSTQLNGAALVYSSGNKIRDMETTVLSPECKFSSLCHLPSQHTLKNYWIK